MTIPTFHTNGTSASDLCDGYQKAALAISEAMCAVSSTCPNARDYYPQGADAYAKARAEHSDRLDRLEALRTAMESLAIICADNISPRRS